MNTLSDILSAEAQNMKNDSQFWDRIARRYAKSPVSDQATYQQKLEKTRGYFQPDMNVLEIGCGTGSTAIAHAPYVKHILATDISKNMIQIGQDRALDQGVENITFEQRSMENIVIAEHSMDAVLGLNLLHLVEDMPSALGRVYDMLKPEGVFVSSTMCLGDSYMKFFKFIGPIGRWLKLLPLIRVFTSKQLIEELVRTGFEIDYQWQPGKNKAIFVVAKKPS